MKKFLMILAAVVLSLSLTSCGKKNADATVKIKVVNSLGAPQSSVLVYMFEATDWNHSESFRAPIHAHKQVATESNGVATFELREAFDLEIIDTQTTLFFATFDADENITGEAAVTVKKGETKEATIRQKK